MKMTNVSRLQLWLVGMAMRNLNEGFDIRNCISRVHPTHEAEWAGREVCRRDVATPCARTDRGGQLK